MMIKIVTFNAPCQIDDTIYTVESVVNVNCEFSL